MLIFISGGSASGKSALAERVCCALPGEHIYIATMPVRSAEDERKVARHHALRAGRGFAGTLEMPGKPDFAAVPPDAAVLFECLSTYTANRMFSGETPPAPRTPTGAPGSSPAAAGTGFTGGASPDAAAWLDALWAELQPLISRPGHTVIVSAEVGCDGARYDPATEEFRAVLTGLGVRLCAAADAAAEAVCGVPVVHKGALPLSSP